MKIALVVPGGVDESGEYRVIPALLALIKRLSVHHEVHVFALHQEERPRTWMLLGAHVHNVGLEHMRRGALRAIRAEHRSGAFDIVHSIWSGTPGLVAVTAGWMLGVASIVHLGGGELVALSDIAYGGRLTRKGRVREAVVLRAATAVTAASEPMIRDLAQLGISARRVPLGVDLETWQPCEPRRRARSKPARLIHVASLNKVKDQSTLLRALAQLRNFGAQFEVDVVGEDTLNGTVQALAGELGLSGLVRFHGFLPHRSLRSLMATAHLLLVSSRHEAGPLAVLEAAAAGIPTVGTAVGHIAEWAPDAAVAVPCGDSAGLAREARTLLANEDERLRIAQEASVRAIREDADYTAEAFEAIYTELVPLRNKRKRYLLRSTRSRANGVSAVAAIQAADCFRYGGGAANTRSKEK